MAQLFKEVKVYTVYVCPAHGTMLKNCCKEAEHIGWMDESPTEQSQG